MFIALLILLIIIIVVAPAARANSARNASQALLDRMGELGDVTQHGYRDVVAKLGNPNSIDGRPGGGRFVQWITPHYHVAMTFDADGQCLGIGHESTT